MDIHIHFPREFTLLVETEPSADLADITKKLEIIMSKQSEAAATLNEVLAQQKKTAGEIAEVQKTVDVLKQKIAEMEQAAGEVDPELQAAIAAVKQQAQIVDDLIPDVEPPPAEEPPAEPAPTA